MKRNILFLFLFVGALVPTSIKATAQTGIGNHATSVENNLYKVNFFMPGFGYEHALSDKITIGADIGFVPLFYARELRFSNGTEKKEALIIGALQLEGQGRYYYNLAKRARKGRNVSGNSGNYLAVSSSVSRRIFTIYDEGNKKDGSKETNNNIMPGRYNYRTGVFWGLQRTYNNLYINLEGGLSYQLGNNEHFFSPELKFKLGYFLFR